MNQQNSLSEDTVVSLLGKTFKHKAQHVCWENPICSRSHGIVWNKQDDFLRFLRPSE